MGGAPALPAAARVVRTGAPQQLAPRSAAACAAPAPPLQQLRSTRLLAGLRRCVLLPPRGVASARRCVCASALPDGVMEDLQRPPEHRKRDYLPHELLRAAVQLSDLARRGKAAQLRVPPYHADMLLMGCTALLPCTHSRDANGWLVVLFESAQKKGAEASQGGSRAAPTPLYDVAAAQRRLLRLMDALEAAAPAVLHGGGKNTAASLHHLTERAGALAAFAAHVADDAWAHPPETWTPHKSHRYMYSGRRRPPAATARGRRAQQPRWRQPR
jgi:hypothetical protein